MAKLKSCKGHRSDQGAPAGQVCASVTTLPTVLMLGKNSVKPKGRGGVKDGYRASRGRERGICSQGRGRRKAQRHMKEGAESTVCSAVWRRDGEEEPIQQWVESKGACIHSPF